MTAEKVLAVARSQIGVTENPPDSNNVIYNTWYYNQEVYDGLWGCKFPWCMAFVQWCFAMAGLELQFKTASCSSLLSWYNGYQPDRVYKTPQPGDIVIYNGHTGIVESVESTKIFVAIEGNTSVTNFANGGEVQRVRRTTDKVVAFIRPYDYDTEADGGEAERTEVRYNSVNEMPEYFREDAQRLIDRGALRGGDDGKLDISHDMLRTLIICQRMIDEDKTSQQEKENEK